MSKDLYCVDLLGVWNWRGTNEYGGKVALPDWESIALNGRQVYVVFDSDVMTKPEVHAALERHGAVADLNKPSAHRRGGRAGATQLRRCR